MILFLVGLVIGLATYRVYLKYQKSKFLKDNISLKLVERSKDVIYYYQVMPVYKHIYTSPSVDFFLGKGTLEALNKDSNTPFEMIHPEDKAIMEAKVSGEIDYNEGIIQRLKGTDGIYHYFEEYATPIYENGKIVAIQGIMRNIDDKVKLERELYYQSTHDALTNIYNRGYFDKMLHYYNELENVSIGMILCDVDKLKFVNDTYGHKKGDQLIQAVAKLLTDFFSDTTIICRVGGDEFVIILPKTSREQLDFLFDHFRKKINHSPVESDGIHLQMSIGKAFRDQSFNEMESIYIEADKNMYIEKNQKRNLTLRL